MKANLVRMPDDLYAAVKEMAMQERKSMNAWCVEQLRIAVNESQVRNLMLMESEIESIRKMIDESEQLVA